MEELIKVNYENSNRPTVMGRDLHEVLGINSNYTTWFDRMCDYGFIEKEDYVSCFPNLESKNQHGGQNKIDHQLTIEMAKEICMIQRTDIGRKTRKYFLAVEERYKKMSLDYSGLSPQLQLLINIETQQQKQQQEIDNVNTRLDNMVDVISLDKNSWRKDSQHLISKIATKIGGFECMKNVYQEVFQLVEERAGVALGTRLTNKRNRMAGEGVCKSKRDKLTKIDIIAEDKKLIEIYVAIVKEMAVKYGVC